MHLQEKNEIVFRVLECVMGIFLLWPIFNWSEWTTILGLEPLQKSVSEYTTVNVIHVCESCHCNLHPLQVDYCCRNSRLVVDKYDLKYVKNSRKLSCIVNQFHGNFHSKTSNCSKIKPVYRGVKWCFNASRGIEGLFATDRGEKHDIPAGSGDWTHTAGSGWCKAPRSDHCATSQQQSRL